MKKYMKYIKTALKVIFTVALVLVLYRNSDWKAGIRHIGDIRAAAWVVIVAVALAQIAVKTGRWKQLLPGCRFKALLRASFMASFFNLIVPSQLASEGTKVFLLAGEPVTKSEIAASLVADKLLGLISIILLGLTGFMLSDCEFPPVFFCAVTMAAVLLMAFFFATRVPVIRRLLDGIMGMSILQKGILKVVTGFVRRMLDAWYAYSDDLWLVLRCIGWGLLLQFLSASFGWLICNSIGAAVALKEWLWIDAYSTLVLVLPVSVGGIGVRDGSLISALSKFGVAPEAALTISLVMYLTLILRGIIGFAVYMGRKG